MKDLWRLLTLYKRYWIWIVVGIVASFVATLAGVALLAISGWFLTSMAVAGMAGVSFSYTMPAILMALCAMIRTFGRYGERLITHEATFRVIATLRPWLYEKIEPIMPSQSLNMRDGDIVGRLRGDIDNLERFYLGFLVPFCVAVMVSVTILITLGYYSITLMIWIAVWYAFAAFILPFIMFLISRYREETTVNAMADLKTVTAENLQAMGELLIYDTDGQDNQDLKTTIRAITQSQMKSGWFKAISNAMMILMMGIATIGGLLICADLNISAAFFVMLIMLILAGFEALAMMPAAILGLGAVLRSAHRVFDLADQKPTVQNMPSLSTIPQGFALDFKAVNFTYPDSSKPILKNLSFSLQAGQTMALIGPTGCGKSTIINMLERFYDPQSGTITLNGKDIADYDVEALRSQFSVMTQRPYLFMASIRDNIMMANESAFESDLHDVCRIAGLTDFIESLPNGYDTYVGEHGKRLSGGQIKRIGLARALLKPSQCLILDEPGAGLDYQMERDVMDAVFDNLGDRALILITHRYGHLDDMDHVLTLSE